MKKAVHIVLALFLTLAALPARAQVDSVKLKELDARLDEYFRTMENEGSALKDEECDALIGSAKDSLLRQHIALKVYDHYLNSPLMGDEAVAVHTVDTWFASGRIQMNSEIDLMNAKIYADFNRQSLIGMKAPELKLLDPQGDTVTVGGRLNGTRVLFFYDTDCSKCKLESLVLKSLLNDKNYPLTLYAIYTGSNADAWASWRESRFTLKADATTVVNLWDPEVSSDYQMKYGIIQTPRMFLLDHKGIIRGRGMDSDALETMMTAILADENYAYGSDESNSLMDQLFLSFGDSLEPSDVLDIAALIKERTIGGKGLVPRDYQDTIAYKHLAGDLLYYLSQRRGEALKEGSLPFIKDYMLSAPDIWDSEDDSLRVLGLADLMSEMLSRTPVGSKLPNEPVKGWKKISRKGGYIIFHTEGCPDCQKAIDYASAQGYRWLDVNVDRTEEGNSALMKRLLDTFDLSSLPFIIEVEKGGTIKRRYVSLP